MHTVVSLSSSTLLNRLLLRILFMYSARKDDLQLIDHTDQGDNYSASPDVLLVSVDPLPLGERGERSGCPPKFQSSLLAHLTSL